MRLSTVINLASPCQTQPNSITCRSYKNTRTREGKKSQTKEIEKRRKNEKWKEKKTDASCFHSSNHFLHRQCRYRDTQLQRMFFIKLDKKLCLICYELILSRIWTTSVVLLFQKLQSHLLWTHTIMLFKNSSIYHWFTIFAEFQIIFTKRFFI